MDWEKAFDKVDREGMFKAMDRMGVDNKLIEVIKGIYKDTEFMVEIDGDRSTWHTQNTGIRQGCPLSPYLFLIVMTCLFADIHEEDTADFLKQRVPNAQFDEVLFADDTICFSQSASELNHFLHRIEIHSAHYLSLIHI